MNKITIGLVTYNRPAFLKRAIKSILRQKFNGFEVFIGNDYTQKKISFKSLGIKQDKRIKIFNHKKNLGEKNNKNFLLKKCKSEWFMWLADDDYFHKDFFKIMIKNINSNKNAIAYYSNYSRKKLKKQIKFSRPKIYSKLDFLEGFISQKIRLIGVYGFIKTKYLKKIKGIHATGKSFLVNNKLAHIYPYCDLLVPILLSKYGKISWTENRLIYLNTNNNSISAVTNDYQAYVSSEKYILKKLKEIIGSKTNSEIKKKIISYIFMKFVFNRLTVIKKTNPFFNIFYFIKYCIDEFYFKIEIKKNSIYSTDFNYLNIVKSIIKSFKNF
tara:strand:+ start:99 stop:1079 length:981 start_codon:yes stop_codon:yes gene_type:complete